MENNLTIEEIQKTKVYVHQFNKETNSQNEHYIMITLKVVFEDEEKMFSINIDKTNENRQKEWYIQKAFRSLKKDIRKWIKNKNKSSVIGMQYSFSLSQFNDDDDHDELKEEATETV